MFPFGKPLNFFLLLSNLICVSRSAFFPSYSGHNEDSSLPENTYLNAAVAWAVMNIPIWDSLGMYPMQTPGDPPITTLERAAGRSPKVPTKDQVSTVTSPPRGEKVPETHTPVQGNRALETHRQDDGKGHARGGPGAGGY